MDKTEFVSFKVFGYLAGEAWEIADKHAITGKLEGWELSSDFNLTGGVNE